MSERSESNVGLTDLLDGFDAWWHGRRYDNDCPSDRHIAEDAWRAARGENYYPCNLCGAWRTKDEGGTTFTVCDDCWVKPPNDGGKRHE